MTSLFKAVVDVVVSSTKVYALSSAMDWETQHHAKQYMDESIAYLLRFERFIPENENPIEISSAQLQLIPEKEEL